MITADTQHCGCLTLPAISVVVCTYNRANLLAGALQTLCEQALNSSHYEIIVVDNNSSDNTRAVTEEFCRCYPNLRYCFEPQQGISHARNRGWREARGEYVAYVDDECKMPKQWLMVAKEVIERLSPDVFGGPYFAGYYTPKPRWFKDSYGSHRPGNEARALKNDCFQLHEGNFFLRRTLLETLGGFDPSLGPVGQKMSYGEGAALLRLIHDTMSDQLIYYDPRLYVYHLVRPEKMTMRWLMRSSFDRGRGIHRVFIHSDSPPSGRRRLMKPGIRILLAIAVDLARSVLRRDRTQYPYVQNYLYENTFRYVQKLGSLYEQYLQIVQKS